MISPPFLDASLHPPSLSSSLCLSACLADTWPGSVSVSVSQLLPPSGSILFCIYLHKRAKSCAHFIAFTCELFVLAHKRYKPNCSSPIRTILNPESISLANVSFHFQLKAKRISVLYPCLQVSVSISLQWNAAQLSKGQGPLWRIPRTNLPLPAVESAANQSY